MIIQCTKCGCKKDESCFSINEKTGELYKSCDKCRVRNKTYDDSHKVERREYKLSHEKEVKEYAAMYRESHRELLREQQKKYRKYNQLNKGK